MLIQPANLYSIMLTGYRSLVSVRHTPRSIWGISRVVRHQYHQVNRALILLAHSRSDGVRAEPRKLELSSETNIYPRTTHSRNLPYARIHTSACTVLSLIEGDASGIFWPVQRDMRPTVCEMDVDVNCAASSRRLHGFGVDLSSLVGLPRTTGGISMYCT